ncbi:LamG-like jellyroll fold domain-containing protein [uncultured Methanomethylovorans sp.]|uniref:LamG-like jellyroll fold domain-containing protein n=1 Tax=uncultured Methanomethylovorans sp. TaxID=183759 RepID=UPI002AA78ECD|nr:LamG-like jellyroll fold domain-containing protein [uncultured Methanomethylovorans sp.]
MRKIIMVVMLLFLIALPAMAATNSYTKTLTTTTELSNGAWYTGYTISGDRIVHASGAGEYISPVFTAVNLTSGDVTYTDDTGNNVIDYAWLYSNSQWLNSTDGRHVTGGHAFYNIRYPFSGSSGGITPDVSIVDSGSSHQDATLGGGATIYSVLNHRYENYISFDGAGDYTRTNYAYDYDAGWWCIAAMIKPDGTAGSPIGISDSGSNAVIELQYIDAAADYWQLLVRDQNDNAVSSYNASVTITPNNWHYIVMYADATYVYVYMDGKYVTKIDMTYNASSQLNLDYIQLGGIYFGGNNIADWAGDMDEFRFMHGALPASERSASGIMGTYMTACVNGNIPPKKDTYKLAGAADANLYTVITGYSIGGYYVNDISMTWTNTKPNIVSMFPVDDYTYDTDPIVTLSVNVTDADITYEDFISAFFYVDGEYEGSASSSTNGEIQQNIGTFTGGYHTWVANIQDSWSGVTTTSTEGFYVLSILYIRDEQDFENLIDDATVTINFYTENTSTTKTSSDGTVDLSGLPVQNLLVTASADGYESRKTIITSLYDAQNIYLISENASTIYNTFKLNTQSISYPVTDYWIDVQKPMNGTVDTVFSSYFGFDGSCGTYLIEGDVYRLVIHSPDGSEVSYGWLYPDPDGTMDITITSSSGSNYVTDWLSSGFTFDEDADTITFSYDSDEEIEAATFVATENNESVASYSLDTNSGTFVLASDSSKHEYLITVTIETEDGKFYNVTQAFTLNPENIDPFPSSYPEWFKQVVVSAIAIVCILAFSAYRADVGCVLGAGVFCTAYIFDWFPIGQAAIYTIILIATAAVIKFKKKQDRVIY